MPLSLLHRRMPRTAAALGAALFALMVGRSVAAPAEHMVVLPGHVPAAVAQAQVTGTVSPSQSISLALTLPLRNQATLTALIGRLYDKNDPLYGQYLTPDQFTASFGPTQADFNSAIAFAQAQGLTVTGQSPNRTVLDVSGTAAQVERAFGVSLNTYQSRQDGRRFYAPSTNPVIPASISGVITDVVGLDTASVWRSYNHVVKPSGPFSFLAMRSMVMPFIGNGPAGGLTPTDIKNAYNLTSVTQNGAGQTLGLFELDGYLPSDISGYEAQFGLPSVPLVNSRIDGYNGQPGQGQGEVTLDIQLQIALAPMASKIIVYEAPNSNQGVVDLYTKIATDNLAKEISTSWGLSETESSRANRNAEYAAFLQMASQGQSIYAAAGDSGAYDDGQSLTVDDPASQPFMVGVGGTKLTVNNATGAYSSEKTWSDPTPDQRSQFGSGGGGGISVVWPLQNTGYTYQVGVAGSMASEGSTTMRNVPDVSLDADPNTGYAFFINGQWGVVGGTSCAAPLWAAYTALVNQKRVSTSQPLLGFPNPSLYSIAKGTNYTNDFHDIADNSTNLFYPAVAGYDNATGLGTFNGANLLADLNLPPLPTAPTALRAKDGSNQIVLTWTAGTGGTSYNLYRSTTAGGEGATPYMTGLTTTTFTDTAVVSGTRYYYQVAAVNAAGVSAKSNEANGSPQVLVSLLTNAGFENGASHPAPWVTTAGVIDNSPSEAPHAGSWKAWLDGYGTAHTDTLSPQVTIPATMNSGTLTFFLHVDTAERSKTTVYDTLSVQVRDLSGNVLGTAAVFSNLDAATGYVQKTVDLSPFLGKAAQVFLVGKEDSSLQTSFVVDDFTLNVQ